ncbi:adenosylmethionine decarboxylase [Infirmifilum sp. SLHALR2]|nr:MAG: adenosylmethionine decarboxylase [Thermofilum sp. NZ13]
MTGRNRGVRGGGVGRHLIVEMFECDPVALDSIDVIKTALLDSAVASNSTVVSFDFYRFKPHGVSGYVLIAESHISIHTWPEYGYAAIDVFTCGEHTDPWKGLDMLRDRLKAKKMTVLEIVRGVGIESYEGYWIPPEKRKEEKVVATAP